jgi:hypothetical protein
MGSILHAQDGFLKGRAFADQRGELFRERLA